MAKVMMKIMKKNLFVAAAMMVAMTACVKEADVNVNVEENVPQTEEKVWVEFTAGVETKVAINEGEGNSRYITWENDDKVMINGEEFAVTETDGRKATFGANVPVGFTEATEYNAIYPASAVKDGKITVNGTAGVDGIVAVAKSTDMSLQFKHVTSLIKFQVPSDFAVTSVTISAVEPLTGDVAVSMTAEDANPTFEVSNSANTVTLNGTFTAGTDYYVPVLPGTKTNLTVRLNGYLSWTKTATINQGRVANMGLLPTPTTTVYMKPSNDWKNSGKNFSAWIWEGDKAGAWYTLSDGDSDGIYEVTFPVNLNKIIFVLMNGTNDWNNKLDQTGDLSVPTDSKNAYIIYSSEWATVSDAKTFTEPEKVCRLTVKVNKKIEWYDKYLYSWTAGTNASNGMGIKLTWDKEDGNYYVYYHNFPYSLNGKKIDFNINNGQWGNNNQTVNLNVSLSESCTVTIETSHVKK